MTAPPCAEDIYPAKIALYVDQTLLSEERLELIEQIAHAIKAALSGLLYSAYGGLQNAS